MNVFDFLSPHLPADWSAKHKSGDTEHDLGTAHSTPVVAVPPAMKWAVQENGGPHEVRLTLLDQHGHVKVEVDGHAKDHPGANGGFGHMGGVSAIIKCTYQENGVRNEYRFEGKLVNGPFA